MAASFDLLVIGDDAPSLAAAACAAQTGASVALADPVRARLPAGASLSAIPNFVWRRLDLQNYDLRLEPVSARITLFENDSLATPKSIADTVAALREKEDGGAALWPDFVADMASVDQDNDLPSRDMLALSAHQGDVAVLTDAAMLAGAATDLIEDYLNGGMITNHVNAHALGVSGHDGTEAGSAGLIPSFLSEDAWPVRSAKKGTDPVEALRAVCAAMGVTKFDAPVIGATASQGKTNALVFAQESNAARKLRANAILFASPDSARRAGYDDGYNFQNPFNAGHAVLRIKLRSPLDMPAGDTQSLFQIVDDGENLKRARGATLDGQIPEDPPVSFEFLANGDLIVRSRYIPARLRDEEGWRDWTGQDRQILQKVMIDRLASRLPGVRKKIARKKLFVDECSIDRGSFATARRVYIQRYSHNEVTAAVMLADRILTDG